MALTPTLRSRFQGCLAGAASGDCLGAPFEIYGVDKKYTFGNLIDFFQSIGKEIKDKDYLAYTDDTAMCRCIAESLKDNQGKFNSKDLAKKFGLEYAHAPGRGYGASVITVLKAFKEDMDDVFEPAKKQFDGSGSYGNGAGMRVAPVALCPEANFDQMIEVARQSGCLTHSNFLGYCGGILQACAVHLALHADPANFNTDVYINRLIEVMEKEDSIAAPAAKVPRSNEDSSSERLPNPEYCRRLKLFKPLLEEDADFKKVAAKLGNEISAHKSVPAAVYSFLRCLKPVEGLPTSNPLERTILYAISLDGDTDTIGSMAGAIAGAFYGVEQVPPAWKTVCEGVEDAIRQADALYGIHYGSGETDSLYKPD